MWDWKIESQFLIISNSRGELVADWADDFMAKPETSVSPQHGQALRSSASHSEAATGLTAAQMLVMKQIHDERAVSMNALAALTFTHQSTVSEVVSRLEAMLDNEAGLSPVLPSRRHRPRPLLAPARRDAASAFRRSGVPRQGTRSHRHSRPIAPRRQCLWTARRRPLNSDNRELHLPDHSAGEHLRYKWLSPALSLTSGCCILDVRLREEQAPNIKSLHFRAWNYRACQMRDNS